MRSMRKYRCMLPLALAAVLMWGAGGACSQPAAAIEHKRQVERGLVPRYALVADTGRAATIEERLAYYGIPGVSVAVVYQGMVDWVGAYGATEAGGDTPVNGETLFLAGSVSKPVAAVGAMVLVEDGTLALDTNVNTHLTTWKVPENVFTTTEKVTLRRLLSHTAGTTVHGFPGYRMGAPVPTLVQVLNGEAPANTPPVRVDVVPGSTWRYSGGGYTIAQLLMMDATGTPFARLMRERVLGPLGMTLSTFEQPLPDSLAALASAGHYAGGSKVEGNYHIYPEMAAAGLWTNARDLGEFVAAIQQMTLGRSDLLTRESALEMLQVQQNGYGLGFGIEGEGPDRRFAHGGVDEGFDTQIIGYVEKGLGVVVMANANLARGLIDEIVASVARVYQWPGFDFPEVTVIQAIPEDFLHNAPGRYTLGERSFRIIRRGERLFMAVQSGNAEVYRAFDGTYMVPGIGIRNMAFTYDEAGRVVSVRDGVAYWRREDH